MRKAFADLTPAQGGFLLFCFAAWLLFAIEVPQACSLDVYLFRDAAVNLLEGRGFATASFEKSTSFHPLLYTSYTPLTQWVFAVFAKGSGPLWRAASLDTFVLAAAASLLVLRWALPLAETPARRRLLVLLAGAALPAGFLAPEGDRPEALSFVLLLLLLASLSGARQKTLQWAVQGLLAGLAFLSEPFAGVLAVLLIAASACAAAVQERAPGRLAAQGALGAALFAMPVVAVALGFQHADPGALARFQGQAKYAGAQRPIHYIMSADQTAEQTLALHDSLPRKMLWGMGADLHAPFSALHLLSFLLLAGGALILAFAAGRGRPAAWAGIAALFLVFALPVFAFPLQSNYRVLATGIGPAALAIGWAGLRLRAPGQRLFLWGLFALQFALTLPNLALAMLSRLEVRRSYLGAVEQARETGAYLETHGLGEAVLVVPASDYYIYKPFHANVYNPNYYARVEGTAALGGLVECKNASRDLGRQALAPSLPGAWMLLSHADDPVAVSLAGRRLMRRNWSLGCDVYVLAPGSKPAFDRFQTAPVQ